MRPLTIGSVGIGPRVTSAPGGHVGLDEAANQIFDYTRLGLAVETTVIATIVPHEPLFLLDAGCGKLSVRTRPCHLRLRG